MTTTEPARRTHERIGIRPASGALGAEISGVDLCCEAWNKLIDQPWTIMSIGQRKWAHGF